MWNSLTFAGAALAALGLLLALRAAGRAAGAIPRWWRMRRTPIHHVA